MKDYTKELERLRNEREEIRQQISDLTQQLREKRNALTRQINIVETTIARQEPSVGKKSDNKIAMTESDRAQIVKLWEARVPAYRIIMTLPYKTSVARAMIKELKDDGTLKKRDTTKVDIVANAYRNGMTNTREIAEVYGISLNTVYCYLSRRGIKTGRPEHNYKKDEKTLQIVEEIKSGKGFSEIARQFGCTRQWVYLVKNRMEKGCYD